MENEVFSHVKLWNVYTYERRFIFSWYNQKKYGRIILEIWKYNIMLVIIATVKKYVKTCFCNNVALSRQQNMHDFEKQTVDTQSWFVSP